MMNSRGGLKGSGCTVGTEAPAGACLLLPHSGHHPLSARAVSSWGRMPPLVCFLGPQSLAVPWAGGKLACAGGGGGFEPLSWTPPPSGLQ